MSKKIRKCPLEFKGEVLLSNYNRKNFMDKTLKPYEAIIIKKEGAL